MLSASQESTERRAYEDLKAMVKIASVLAGPAGFEEKAYQVMKEMLAVASADVAILRTLDQESSSLRAVAWAATFETTPLEYVGIGDSLSGISFRQDRSLIANELSDYPLASQLIIDKGVMASAFLPIRSGGRTFGVIIVSSCNANHFTEERVVILAAIADGIGTLLEKNSSQELLARSEEKYRDLFENASDLVQSVSPDGALQYVNQAWRDTLQYDDDVISNISFLDIVHPDYQEGCLDIFQRAMRGEEVGKFETAFLTRDRRKVMVEGGIHCRVIDGKPAGIQGIFRDISERKLLQEQLSHFQQMETMGRMAGGVAHDFNNLLTPILGFCELARECIPRDHPATAHLEEIQKAARVASAITGQLLAFTRRNIVESQVVDLNDLVSEAEPLLQRIAGPQIQMEVVLDSDLCLAEVDSNQINQILVNLVKNARDAMPDGGNLSIATCSGTSEVHRIQFGYEVVPGDYVMLTVRDSGIGMTDEAKAHLFEPYFTTKSMDKGTGLGLSTCYGIVRQYKGHMEVQSEPGMGTEVTVCLPKVVTSQAPGKKEEDGGELPRGSGKVLLAEDEPSVRALAARVLRNQGFSVIEASDGADAIHVLDNEDLCTIDILVTDVVMPRVGGSELAEKVRCQHPGIKVLFTSGYIDDAPVAQASSDPGAAFLQKPFTPQSLICAVVGLLNGRSPGSPC
ncbi:MAG: ATP-binding protein [Dehalococcoidia bacterium]